MLCKQIVFAGLCCTALCSYCQSKPAISLDEFMNTTEIRDARISPDGSAAVIATTAPDWKASRFQHDLWLWTKGQGLRPLTHSGHADGARWSPDGKYIAFVSDRAPATGEQAEGDTDDKDEKNEPGRVWVIPVSGGEAFPLYREKLDVHSFDWTPDGAAILFSTTEPLSKDAEDAKKKEWKDVVRWREQERGDVLLRMPLQAAVAATTATPEAHQEPTSASDKPMLPVAAQALVHSAKVIEELAISPHGEQIAFETGPTSHREENPSDSEIFVVSAAGGEARQLTHNEAIESDLTWAPSGKEIYFLVRAGAGSLEGPYRDVQGRLYSLSADGGAAKRLGSDFTGSWQSPVVASDGTLLAAGETGVYRNLYRVSGYKAELLAGNDGNYGALSAATHGAAVLFTSSSITKPTQVFVAANARGFAKAEQITSFNPIFDQRAKVQWRTFDWKSGDGTPVQGMLLFPPDTLSSSGGGDAGPKAKPAKPMRMLTLIHGGPEDADGDRFGADWYSWAAFAASQGWVVFQPNYRGSLAYGDKFMLAIQPQLVSSPGRDILAGVDALVAARIADPQHLAIGGYSYGGYMTNWLITQTTEFKAAVTGAGAVEHAANWGFDDLTFDDAWYLSGAPWEKPALYQSEAALFRMDKVKTPTHAVGGSADNRVSFFEQIVLERALERLNVPHTLLQFPGENHPLSKNPWHGYIKVREEMKWINQYAGQ